jgi:sulfatase maturation enzyme AslB (radical SAM superfamily)
MARVFRLSVEHFRRTGEVPVRLFRRRPSEDVISEPSPTLCGAGGSDYLTIDVDGEVSGCVLFARSYQRFPDTPLGRAVGTLHAGRIDDPNLRVALADCRRRIESTRLFTDRPSKRSSYGRCGTCRYRRACSLCPVTIVHQPGNTDPNRVPNFVCAFWRAVGKFRRRFPPVPTVTPLTADGRLRPSGRRMRTT